MSTGTSEADAVIQRYGRRDVGDLYDPLRPEVCMATQERDRALAAMLRKHVGRPLRELRAIEIGCGSGSNLLQLLRLGFDPERLVANELLPERFSEARRNLPEAIEMLAGDAISLTLQRESFDVVYVSLVFSSLLDRDYQSSLAAHIWEWLRPGGAILWYDFVYDNPRNRDVRGVPIGRVRELFPLAAVDYRRVTLAPPLARFVAAKHSTLYALFNALPFLRTHTLCWIGKQ